MSTSSRHTELFAGHSHVGLCALLCACHCWSICLECPFLRCWPVNTYSHISRSLPYKAFFDHFPHSRVGHYFFHAPPPDPGHALAPATWQDSYWSTPFTHCVLLEWDPELLPSGSPANAVPSQDTEQSACHMVDTQWTSAQWISSIALSLTSQVHQLPGHLPLGAWFLKLSWFMIIFPTHRLEYTWMGYVCSKLEKAKETFE